MSDVSQTNLFGEPLEGPTESTPTQELTYCRQGSRASLTALRESVKRLVTSVTYGERLPVSFARLNPDGSWAKMSEGCCQVRTDGSLEEFCETWPTQGILSDGICTRPPTSEHRTAGRGCLSSGIDIGTPTASMSIRSQEGRKGRTPNPAEMVAMMLLPTPCAMDVYKEQMTSTQQSAGSRHSLDLPSAVKMLPTPKARDGNNVSIDRGRNNLGEVMQEKYGEKLSVKFVTRLMGFSDNWLEV